MYTLPRTRQNSELLSCLMMLLELPGRGTPSGLWWTNSQSKVFVQTRREMRAEALALKKISIADVLQPYKEIKHSVSVISNISLWLHLSNPQTCGPHVAVWKRMKTIRLAFCFLSSSLTNMLILYFNNNSKCMWAKCPIYMPTLLIQQKSLKPLRHAKHTDISPTNSGNIMSKKSFLMVLLETIWTIRNSNQSIIWPTI